MERRTFVKALGGVFAAAASANFPMYEEDQDKLTPEEDAKAVVIGLRNPDGLVSQFPDQVADVIEQLVLRVRELEDS